MRTAQRPWHTSTGKLPADCASRQKVGGIHFMNTLRVRRAADHYCCPRGCALARQGGLARQTALLPESDCRPVVIIATGAGA